MTNPQNNNNNNNTVTQSLEVGSIDMQMVKSIILSGPMLYYNLRLDLKESVPIYISFVGKKVIGGNSIA